MRWIDIVRVRWSGWFRRRRWEAQLDADLQFHLEQETTELIRTGVPPAEARRRAAAAMGGVEGAKEAMRDLARAPLIETLWREIRFAGRSLRKSATFTAATALTLALGIGANAAIFAMFHAAVLRPAPYPEPDRLAILSCTVTLPGRTPSQMGWSYPKFEDLRRTMAAPEAIEGFYGWDMNLTGAGDAARVNGELVTGGYFMLLGIPPLVGRTILPADDRPGADAVAVISADTWRRCRRRRSAAALPSQPRRS